MHSRIMLESYLAVCTSVHFGSRSAAGQEGPVPALEKQYRRRPTRLVAARSACVCAKLRLNGVDRCQERFLRVNQAAAGVENGGSRSEPANGVAFIPENGLD